MPSSQAKYELLPSSRPPSRSTSPAPPYSPLPPYPSTLSARSSFDSLDFDPDFDPSFDDETIELRSERLRLNTTFRHTSGSSSSSPGSPDSLEDEDLEHSSLFATNPRTRDTRECIRAFHADPRFNPPPPSPLARGGLILATLLLFYCAFAWRKAIWVDFGMGMGDHVQVVDSY